MWGVGRDAVMWFPMVRVGVGRPAALPRGSPREDRLAGWDLLVSQHDRRPGRHACRLRVSRSRVVPGR